MLKKLQTRFKYLCHLIRRLSGDDAYEQYLKHYAAYHANTLDAPPALDKRAFYKLWEEDKWKAIKRCC